MSEKELTPTQDSIGLKMSSIPSQKSLDFTGNIKSEYNQKRVNHALAYPKMR